MFEKLMQLAALYGVDVISDSSMRYSYTKRNIGTNKVIIGIYPYIVDIERLISFSHELGHVVDYRENYNSNRKLYNHIYRVDKLSKETIAWEIAEELLIGVGFTNWVVFDHIKFSRLRTYIRTCPRYWIPRYSRIYGSNKKIKYKYRPYP